MPGRAALLDKKPGSSVKLAGRQSQFFAFLNIIYFVTKKGISGPKDLYNVHSIFLPYSSPNPIWIDFVIFSVI